MIKALPINPLNQWVEAIPKEKLTITLSKEYIKNENLQDECMIAVVFDYPNLLLQKMYDRAFPCEKPAIELLMMTESHCCHNGNNIIIKN